MTTQNLRIAATLALNAVEEHLAGANIDWHDVARVLREALDEMLRITELREGGEIGLTFEGTLVEVVEWLKENYDKLFDWIEDPDLLPDLENIETVRDLKVELDKVDHDWWSVLVECVGQAES